MEAETTGREAAARALGARVSVGIRGLLDRVERASGSIADAASRGRERAADGLRRSAALRHGLAAAERGNVEAALALFCEAVEQAPENGEAVIALWNVALVCDRAPVASSALARWIHTQASSGRFDRAVELWIELGDRAPSERADAPTLVRMLPELRRRVANATGHEARAAAQMQLLRALRQSIEPGAHGLTTGLAMRVFEQARFLDADTARRAGEVVLAAPDLHEAKRRSVEAVLARLDAAAAADRAPDPAKSDDAADGEPAAPVFRPIEAIPIELCERGLIVCESASGQRMRIDLRAVAAIAVVCIGDPVAKPAPLIDLVLRRTPRARDHRIVRMYADSFEASALAPDAAPGDDPLGSLLGELLDRSGAVPLPDPDSALGVDPKTFATIGDYERSVLARVAALAIPES